MDNIVQNYFNAKNTQFYDSDGLNEQISKLFVDKASECFQKPLLYTENSQTVGNQCILNDCLHKTPLLLNK